MRLESVKGQQRAVSGLQHALKTGTVHHAYLFAGPEGVGKERAALGLTLGLLCPVRPGEGCDECELCTRALHRMHPDVTWVLPEEEQIRRGWAGRSDFTNTPSREIRVEQVRALQARLALRPLEGTTKVALIASADRLNPQAQNALLKTLEEPPGGTVLVLIASTPERLLPTIRSRVLRVQFGPLEERVIAERLQEAKGWSAEEAAEAARWSQGSLADAMAQSPEALAERRRLITDFEAALRGDALAVLGFAESAGASREKAEEALRTLAAWTLELMAAGAGGRPLPNGLEEEGGRTLSYVDGPSLLNRARRLEEALAPVATRNASARLQLERMLLLLQRSERRTAEAA